MPNPYSRFLTAGDWERYPRAVREVVTDRIQEEDSRYELRRSEYAAIVDAVREHWLTGTPLYAVDIGDCHSPLPAMLQELCGVRPAQVDPSLRDTPDLYEYVRRGPHLAHIVTCSGVLGQVEDLPQALEDLAALVVPGGVLAITVDCIADAEGVASCDTYAAQWPRRRRFTPEDLRVVLQYPLQACGLAPFGQIDWTVPAAESPGFASLCLVRPLRRRR